MKAIGYKKAGPIEATDALMEIETEIAAPGAHDLLVELHGVSLNPVDVKLRANAQPKEDVRILGFDGAGIVKEVGTAVSLFKPGDAVFYAGDITRPGTNAAFHLVDERIVGHKPASLDFAPAAALPLTGITAWEILFDSLALEEGGASGEALLVIGGAGGVGSMLIQLAKKLTGLEVIATASRPASREWVEKMGADHVINHNKPLAEEINKLGITPRYVAALTNTLQHFASIIELIKPRGRIAVIDDPQTLDVAPLKSKAISLCWEFMFTRSMFQTDDMDMQHKMLNRIAALVDQGSVRSTATENFGRMSVENLCAAHQLQESGKMVGKSVLAGFG